MSWVRVYEAVTGVLSEDLNQDLVIYIDDYDQMVRVRVGHSSWGLRKKDLVLETSFQDYKTRDKLLEEISTRIRQGALRKALMRAPTIWDHLEEA